MSDISTAIKNIYAAIDIGIKKAVSTLAVDITHQGRIVATNGNYRYGVSIKGKTYASVPSCTDVSFAINEAVWVTVPQGNFEQMFIVGRRRG